MDISWLNNVLMAAAVTFLLYGAWRLLGNAAPTIDRSVLAEAVSEGALLLDVRTPAEFAGGHLAGARNAPLGELPHRATKLGSKKRPVLVYCHSGARSRGAKRSLDGAGFRQVIDLGSMSHAERTLTAVRQTKTAAAAAR